MGSGLVRGMELEHRWVIVRHVGVDHAVLVANPVEMCPTLIHFWLDWS